MGQALSGLTGEYNTPKRLTKKESPRLTAEGLYRKYEYTVKAYIQSLSPLCSNLVKGKAFHIQ